MKKQGKNQFFSFWKSLNKRFSLFYQLNCNGGSRCRNVVLAATFTKNAKIATVVVKNATFMLTVIAACPMRSGKRKSKNLVFYFNTIS